MGPVPRLKNTALWLAMAFAAALACDGPTQPRYYQGTLCSESAAGDLFQQRIAPLLADDRPSSCNECHLSGVDLSMFVRDTPCETMACLKELGWVDYGDPEASKILTFIERANPQSPLITQNVIDQEYEGFLDWVKFSAACDETACGGVTCGTEHDTFCDTAEEPELEQLQSEPQPTGCSDRDIEQLFLDSVYSSRGRCFPCHFDNWEQNNIGSPMWLHTSGTCNQASLATLREIERSGYINVENPQRSLLLLKPLAEDEGGVEHGGGDKFHTDGDSAYFNFLRFLEHYSECKRGSGEHRSRDAARD